METRDWRPYRSEGLVGVASRIAIDPGGTKSLLILLHGMGSNEEALLEDAEAIAPESELLSLRGPIQLGRIAFAWYQEPSTTAEDMLTRLTQEIKDLSESESVPLKRIFVLGFSQGGILTLGLLLKGELTLGGYLVAAARTLPEFADYAKTHPEISKNRSVYLMHGTRDEVLPINHGRETETLLSDLDLEVTYREYGNAHGISLEALDDARKWVAQKLL